MKTWIVLAAALLCTAPAQSGAQEVQKVAVSGKPIILVFAYDINPDCTNRGYSEIMITQRPQNGRTELIKTNSFPVYPASNIRSACNHRRVPGVELRYTSQRGFVGIDHVALEAISTSGHSISRRYAIAVSAAPSRAHSPMQQVQKVAMSGKPILLNFVNSLNPDCTNIDYPEVRIMLKPQNGFAELVKTTNYPGNPASDTRSACNHRRVPGVELRYTSQKGFVGVDYVEMEAISPYGLSISRRYAITVK